MTTVNPELRGIAFGASGKQQTLSGQIATKLHAAILRGDFEGGSQLKILDLATRYETSAMPIREALRQLSNLGMVELIPNRGARVLELSLQDMRDTMSTRLLLEPEAVAQAARSLSHEDIARATRALSEMEAHVLAGEQQKARSAHEEFHFTLYRAASSSWLIRLIEMLWHNADRYRFAYPLSEADQAMSDREHREMVATCISGDSDGARKITRQHIERSMARMEASFLQAQSENQQLLNTDLGDYPAASHDAVLTGEAQDPDNQPTKVRG